MGLRLGVRGGGGGVRGGGRGKKRDPGNDFAPVRRRGLGLNSCCLQ